MVTRLELYGPIDPELKNSEGMRFRDFRRQLTPRYWQVWSQLAFGHVMMVGSLWLTTLPTELWARLLVGIVGAGLIGYWMAYVQLYLHEAAHYGLAANRRANDLIANVVVGMWIGQDIRSYRKVHFIHHRELGTPEDSERSYTLALTVNLILESLTGIRVIRVVAMRRAQLRALDSRGNPLAPAASKVGLRDRWPVALGLASHGLLIGLLAVHSQWIPILAWSAGVASIYPFLTSLRQLLEHRPLSRSGSNDAEVTVANRLFGDGLLASTFGAAGFNRHLLHHMEPQVSCTRLPDLERFVRGSSRAAWLEAHQSTYSRTFSSLIYSDKRRSQRDLIPPVA